LVREVTLTGIADQSQRVPRTREKVALNIFFNLLGRGKLYLLGRGPGILASNHLKMCHQQRLSIML